MRVLGIDCGSRSSGYGLIDTASNPYALVSCGTIRCRPTDPLPLRLRAGYSVVARIIREHRPEAVALESLFYAVNVRSVLQLGHVRGVFMFAAAEADLPVFEYSPLEVKSAVTGYGRAEKLQVQRMVKALLGLKTPLDSFDASDALAVAICHVQSDRVLRATTSSRL